MPTLRVISRHGVGYNNVDVAAATARGIPVLIAPATNGQSVAELTIGLLLAVARAIPAHDAAIRQGNWDRSGSGLQLAGRTLGVVGFGGIGRAVARAALGLGMRVVAFDEYMQSDSGVLEVEMAASLDDLLGQRRRAFVALPTDARDARPDRSGTASSSSPGRHRRQYRAWRADRRGCLGRGTSKGQLAGAGLDTFADEPPLHSPLLPLRNVVMTPHMGGSTDAALAATAVTAVEHALKVLRGEPVDSEVCVNPSNLPPRRSAT